MITLTRPELDVMARVDLYTFIERVFAELNPGTEFAPNWHVELLASELEAVRCGDHRRLLVNMPPRNLKSICISVGFVAFLLGHEPTKKIMVVSYGMELAEKLARDCRQVMQSRWYQELFPRTRLSPVRQSVADFETTEGGGRIATSRQGAVTGRGADLIIIDDPIKPDEALSESVRTQVNDAVGHTLVTRLNQKLIGALIVVMQRLHEDDLTGVLVRAGGWRHVSLPAIAQTDELWRYTTPLGRRTIVRREGEALHAAREPLEVFAELRAVQGEYHFSAQYLQTPAPLSGGLIKLSGFARYEPHKLPQMDEVIQSWDTANKAGDLNDYSVCTTWGRAGRCYYLLHVDRQKMDYPALKDQVLKLKLRERPNRILIEDGVSGQPLLQELRYEGIGPVTAIRPRGDKVMRLMNASPLIEAGQVYLPTAAAWLADFEHEIVLFPHSRYKDQVDSTSQALNWFMENRREPALVTFYRQEVQQLLECDEPLLRMRPCMPSQMGYGRDTRAYSAGPDGTVLVPQTDALQFMNNGWTIVSPARLRA